MKQITDSKLLAVEDTSKLILLDLFDLSELQEIQDVFSRATGVASIITEIDGTPITEPSGFTCFCNDIIRKTEKGLHNSLEYKP